MPCQDKPLQCDRVCGKPLSCGRHMCEIVCHAGSCGPCPMQGSRQCPCGKVTPCYMHASACGGFIIWGGSWYTAGNCPQCISASLTCFLLFGSFLTAPEKSEALHCVSFACSLVIRAPAGRLIVISTLDHRQPAVHPSHVCSD